MNTVTAPTPIIERPNISWETWNFMRQEIVRLQAENTQLRADVAHWEQETNHWYIKATYTDLERQILYRRRSRGADENTGEWMPVGRQGVAA